MKHESRIDGFTQGVGILALLVGSLYALFYGGKYVLNAIGPVPAVNATSSSNATQGAQAAVSAMSDSGGGGTMSAIFFPLKRKGGKELHMDNPYVADVQTYLNKYFNYDLDVDGAFGLDTENAVLDIFGEPAITTEMYNQLIAARVGKPQVV